MSADASTQWELARLRRENEHIRKRLSQLSNLRQRITSSLELATVLQDIVDAACDLAGATYGALAVFDEREYVQTLITHGITVDQRKQLGDLPKGLGLLGLLHRFEFGVKG